MTQPTSARDPTPELPAPYVQMTREHPALMAAYEKFGEACAHAGPLDARTVAIVKLAISLGAGLEGAAHSHARKARDAGWSREELLHVAHLCGPTIGFPSLMRARRWVADVMDGPRGTQPDSGARSR